MNYHIIPVTAFQQNCTLLWCPLTRETAIVDPGGEPPRIRAAIDQLALKPCMILLTHGHLDHVGASTPLAADLGVPILGPQRDDAFLLAALSSQASLFGLPPVPDVAPDRWLEAGEQLAIGEQTLNVLHCPGHTPGHLAFYHEASGLAQVGDILFRGAIGRTDFPRGNHADLLRSIRQRLLPLGDEVRFIPGHGPPSTFGAERRHNPFLVGGSPDA